jgi:hypothetical protein
MLHFSTHHGDPTDSPGDLRFALQGTSDIGQWPNRNNGNVARIFFNGAKDE